MSVLETEVCIYMINKEKQTTLLMCKQKHKNKQNNRKQTNKKKTISDDNHVLYYTNVTQIH